jgi:hypothetical protein
MAMNWFAFFPGLYADPNTGGDLGFFVNPPQNVAASTLGGQGISVVSYSDKQERRFPTSNGSRSPVCRPNGGSSAAIRPTTRC